jgi:putative transposase
LVGRDFTATAPNVLWVTDMTYAPTWSGVADVCFIVDVYSRMIVGWRVASHMRTTMVLDAIEMAGCSRGTALGGLRCHSDAGSQPTSIRYGERLAEIGAAPSIGTVGDSYDNALAETVNGYYKSELMYGPARGGPWRARSLSIGQQGTYRRRRQQFRLLCRSVVSGRIRLWQLECLLSGGQVPPFRPNHLNSQ